MAEEVQGGVCGSTWWNPFSSGGSPSPCSVAQLGDIGNFGWPSEALKSKPKFENYHENPLVFSPHMDSPVVLLDNIQWNHEDLICDGRDNEGNFDTILRRNSPKMMNSNLSSNSPSTITNEGGLITSLPMNSSASYLIKPLLDDNNHDSRRLINQSYGAMSKSQHSSSCSWAKPTSSMTSNKVYDEETRDLESNNNEQPSSKKPRIETPSPLPNFKVRKEKMGDRITALQQLVSPFGKTDTASVLHEAVDYIKFLHSKVNVLSTMYLENGDTIQHPLEFDTLENNEDDKRDLRGRGLCLVPASSIYSIVQETSIEFWTSTYG